MMQYRVVPKNKDKISALGFGCMRLPEKNGRIDIGLAREMVRFAIDNGVNFIDTAMPYHYGASEPFLGKALSEGYRERVKLCTKMPHWSVKTRADMDRFLDSQMARLGAEHLDYYLLHGIGGKSWGRLVDLGVKDFLDSAIQDGRIVNAGFSFHDDINSFKAIVDSYDWTACLVMYSFMDTVNQAGDEGVRYASSKDLAVFVMEPLRGGNLAGRIPNSVESIWGQSETKRAPVEFALRWVWDHPEVTMVLSGMSNMDQVRQNITIADSALPNCMTPEESAIVSRVRDEYYSLMKVQCTGCRYCMPCPFGVNIPACFETYNQKYLFSDGNARMNYIYRVGGLFNDSANASMCTRCGKCLKSCPQKIPIPDELANVAREFEGPTFRPTLWFAKRFLSVQAWRNKRRAKGTIEQLEREGGEN